MQQTHYLNNSADAIEASTPAIRECGRQAGLLNITEYQQLIVGLQAQLKRRDEVIESLQISHHQLTKNCKIQRKLIDHLRKQVDAIRVPQQVATVDSLTPRSEKDRVLSLDKALLRIKGVEEVVQAQDFASPDFTQFEEIDMEEFQPILEVETGFLEKITGRVSRLPGMATGTITREATPGFALKLKSLTWYRLQQGRQHFIGSCYAYFRGMKENDKIV